MEALVPFSREISVILARARDGDMRAWDVTENRHKAGILDTSTVPAAVTPATAARAVGFAEQIAVALDHVGVLAVEMFVIGEGDDARLMVNEIAPRVHNSGHWTADAAHCSQFEQHIRAICGWPLGDSERHSDVVMTNLIGDDVARWREPGRRTRRPAACLRQGGSPPGPQDGPCQSGHTGSENLSQTRRRGRR